MRDMEIAGEVLDGPLASCKPGDWFLSWDAHCEGQTVIAAMGNAIVRQP